MSLFCFRHIDYNVEEHLCTGNEIGFLGEFLRVVADTVDARHEDHRGRADTRQHLRILTGTGGHAAAAVTVLGGVLLNQLADAVIEQHWLKAAQALGGNLHVVGLFQLCEVIRQRLFFLTQLGLIRIADIDREYLLGRNNIDSVRLKRDAARGADRAAARQ